VVPSLRVYNSVIVFTDFVGVVSTQNGLVSFVTFYYKGYSIQGSAKIIHLYLLHEISELVVYYLQLVLLFA
jgi:hypothetical protein